ncbi:lipocalin family protein [Cloacibacterium sp.]|uniref:lipocalin family protein n=1 Tax=Cloacibacterium sp. TaxID=1913682 RepID=UPI0039E31AA7
MKKILFFLFASIVLFSCSRDDDSNSSSTSDSVVGNWYFYSLSLNGTVTKGGVSSSINVTMPVNSCMQKSTIVLNQDGTGNVTSWVDTSGTCTQMQDDKVTYTYDASKKILTMKNGSETDVTNLTKLTGSEMVAEDNVSNYVVDGGTFSGKITTIMYKK